MSAHLNDYDYKLDYTEKDGYCFISSLRKCLFHDHSEMYSNDVIGRLITSEIFNNNQYYNRYYSGNVEGMLRSLDNYINNGVYSQQVVDIVVLAAAKCLSVNLCIYKNAVASSLQCFWLHIDHFLTNPMIHNSTISLDSACNT